MSDIIQMDLIKQVQELFPPLTSVAPQSHVINGFGVVPREDGKIDIYDPEGSLVMTLFRDEDGNICGVEDHVNQESRLICEDGYACQPEESCLYDESCEGAALASSALRFSDEPPVMDIEEPKVLEVDEEELPQVKTKSSEIVAEDTSETDSHGSISGGSHEVSSEAPVVFVTSGSEHVPVSVPQYSAQVACNMADLPSGSESVVVKGMVVSSKGSDESQAEEDASSSRGGNISIDIGEISESVPYAVSSHSDRQTAGRGGDSQSAGISTSTASSDYDVEMEMVDERAERISAASERQDGESSLRLTSDERSAPSVRVNIKKKMKDGHRNPADSPEVIASDVPDHNFVGAPFLASRVKSGGIQVNGKGADEISRQNIKTVDDHNDADRNQGDPDQDHGSQHQDQEEEEDS